jgi:hypothetical protein
MFFGVRGSREEARKRKLRVQERTTSSRKSESFKFYFVDGPCVGYVAAAARS